MSTFRQIGARANYQGGASFNNISLSNQLITSRYSYEGVTGPTGPVGQRGLTGPLALTVEEMTDAVKLPLKLLLFAAFTGDNTFLSNLSGLTKLAVASLLKNETGDDGFPAAIKLLVASLLKGETGDDGFPAAIKLLVASRLIDDTGEG